MMRNTFPTLLIAACLLGAPGAVLAQAAIPMQRASAADDAPEAL